LQVDLGCAEAVRDTSGAVDLHDEVARLLRQIPDPKIQEVLALRAIGYTAAEAAQRAGLTEEAAEKRLARIKTRLSQLLGFARSSLACR
jgi:DNA-directed RNA polymerase specialized sigma24 family protein